MPAEILHIDKLLVDKVVTHWREGKLVAMPTETVYGLAADATNGQAVARIYELKSRPQFNPLIVHVADVPTAKRYVQWNDLADKLAAKYWPGPMTLVLKRRLFNPLSELVSAGGDTLAVRIPAHPAALQLLKAHGGAIAAPSANRSGHVSPTTAQHVKDEFADALPLIVDGGACQVGLESTVIDVSSGAAVILRPGAVTEEMLRDAGFKLEEGSGTIHGNTGGALPSPGMMESHYAPSIPVRLNARGVAENEALLAFGPEPLAGAAETLNLSAKGDLIEAAANLFSHLRALDNPAHRAIAVMSIPSAGIGNAINDRLTRASAPK